MPSSLGVILASRLVSGTSAVETEAWARFLPATEMSSVARKPAGVRAIAFENAAASFARERSRSALALSLFSSFAWVRDEQ